MMATPDLEEEFLRRRTPIRRRETVRRNADRVREAPTSSIAAHNLASALGDAGFWRLGVEQIRNAFSLGIDAPESWLVLARGMVELARYEEAEGAYAAAIARRPVYADALRELAQLRWMASGDADASLRDLDAVLLQNPNDPRLLLLRAQVLGEMGRAPEALAALMDLSRQHPTAAPVLTAAAQASLGEGDPQTALDLSARALSLAPTAPVAVVAYISSCIANGAFDKAREPLAALRVREPLNQHAIALEAMLWRLTDDPRYREIYDYDRFVGQLTLAAPPGWPTLDAYLADLAEALGRAHRFKAHPLHQSIKNGTQITSVLDMEHAATRALPLALEEPIQAHLASLGAGADPLRARNAGTYAIQGMWSISMQSGGSHINHVHPEGWISSACYVAIPDLSDGGGRLKLGEPGEPTPRPCAAERFVDPKPGRLVLFPSYMWHGTTPFADRGARLTFAFDLGPE